MKVRMLRFAPLSPDGLHVNIYQAGQKYDVPDEFGRRMLELGVAEQDKDMGGPPEVKSEPETIYVRKRKKRKSRFIGAI